VVQRPANGGHLYRYLGSGHFGLRYLFQTNATWEPEKMTDGTLLIAGILVFGLLFIGIILTAMEYRDLEKKSDDKLAKQKRDSNDS